MSDDLDMRGLEKLIKALKSAKSSVHVGILGRSGGGRSDGMANAEIGAAHEFGTTTLPVRSFLRMPLTEYLGKALEKSGIFSRDAAQEVLAEGTVRPWLQKIGIIAEGVVAEAFGSNGFGKWAPHAPGYQNNTGMILVDTHQLRDSVTSEVVDG